MIIKTMFAIKNTKTIQLIKEAMNESGFMFKFVDREGCSMEEIRRNIGFGVDIIYIDMDIDNGGIDATVEIKKMSPNTQVIIVSEYDSYDLVRQAFVRGAGDCLLTNASFSVIKKSLNRICEEIVKNKKLEGKVLVDEKRIDILTKVARHSYVYAMTFRGREHEVALGRYREIFKLDTKAYIINIELGSEIYVDDALETQIYNIVESCASNIDNVAVGPVLFNRVILIIPVENIKTGMAAPNSQELAYQIIESLSDELNIDVKVGIGNVVRLENLGHSFEEAIKSLRYKEEEQCVKYEHIANNDKMLDLGQVNEYVSKMIEHIKNGSVEVLDEFERIIVQLERMNLRSRKNKILEILMYTVHSVNEIGSCEFDYVDVINLAKSIEEVDAKELNLLAMTRMNNIIKSIQKLDSDRISLPIRNARKYMENHYNEQISLTEVASEVGVSSQYFSKIFKEETGYNFVEWLNILRIENAKKLLQQKTLSITEIACEIGYNDSNYFSRTFKKYVGVSPRQFQKNNPS